MDSHFPTAVASSTASPGTVNASVQVFEQELLGGELPLLVAFFHAEQSNHKERAALDALAGRFGPQLRIAVAELAHSPEYRNKYRILGTPTFLLFTQGAERDRILGKVDERTLQGFICQALGLAGDSIIFPGQGFSTCQE